MLFIEVTRHPHRTTSRTGKMSLSRLTFAHIGPIAPLFAAYRRQYAIPDQAADEHIAL